jgi:hypothetical protein
MTRLGGNVAGVFEVVVALVWGEIAEGFADRSPGVVEGSGARLSHEAFEFGEDLLDRIEVGAVGRQEQEVGTCGSNGRPRRLSFVAAEGGVRANSRAVPTVLASAHEQSIPIFQQLARGHPPGRDDVRAIPWSPRGGTKPQRYSFSSGT